MTHLLRKKDQGVDGRPPGCVKWKRVRKVFQTIFKMKDEKDDVPLDHFHALMLTNNTNENKLMRFLNTELRPCEVKKVAITTMDEAVRFCNGRQQHQPLTYQGLGVFSTGMLIIHHENNVIQKAVWITKAVIKGLSTVCASVDDHVKFRKAVSMMDPAYYRVYEVCIWGPFGTKGRRSG